MKTIHTIFIIPFFILTGCSTAIKTVKPENYLSYTFEPDINSKAIQVTFQMLGAAKGITYIKHTKVWAGNEFSQDITGFKVLNEGAKLTSTIENNNNHITKVIKHKPNEVLKISYKITQNVPSAFDTYRVIINKKYFHIIGQAGLVTPVVTNEVEPYRINVEFKGFPGSFQFANSFFAQKNKSTFTASINQFLYGVYVGGDYRVEKILIKDKPLYISIRGKWGFKDKELFKLARNIVAYQRNFFNDHNFDHFFISVLPNEKPCCSSGGTGLTNSFATFLPNDATLASHLQFLLSHELFHTWNGQRIRRKDPEQLVYWFSEGFTDFYSRLLLLRSGEITLKDYIDEYNAVLYKYYTSEAINYSNNRVLKDFWNDYQVEKLPYRRGNILAHKWNALIKKSSNNKKSVDNILRDYFNEAKENGTEVSNDSFIRIAGRYYPGGFKDDILSLVERGDTIIPGLNDLGPCVKRNMTMISQFEHGYDSKKTYKSKIITGLKKSSPAYRAGLRNGQKLVDRKIYSPPIKLSWIKVIDKKGKEKLINFNPVKKKKYKAFLYELDEKKYKENPTSCLAWFQESN